MPPTLTRNLVALSQWDVDAAEAIHDATPKVADATPNVASPIEPTATYAAVLIGFGDGQHVQETMRRVAMPPHDRRRYGHVAARKGDPLFATPTIVYEPDLGVVRAALERLDLSSELDRSPLAIVTSPDNLSGLWPYREAIAMGASIVDVGEPDGRAEFVTNLARYAVGAHVDVFTACKLGPKMLENSMANAERYATCPGVAELKDAAKGRPALCIAAGPSLDGSLEVLARPGVRDRFVIVAAQTVLKVLLARGVRPHFVTAIDHSDICRKFYDGLTADDVRGVQLVAKPQCSPAIPEAFPGVVRMFADSNLDAILGKPRDMGTLRTGGSVAHLSYYLARHLGCDPVVLVGHDLAFTGGKHYASGAGIVDRNGVELIEAIGVNGEVIYTDAQMTTYREQFEREFAADAAKGLTTLDGTGGGVRKRGAEPVDLAEVVNRITDDTALDFAPPPVTPCRADVHARIRSFTTNLARVDTLRSRGERLMGWPQSERVGRLLDRIHAQIVKLEPALSISNGINFADSLRRWRACRTRCRPTSEVRRL